jgi:hypothetical protein
MGEMGACWPQVVLSGHCDTRVTPSDIINEVVTRYQCSHYNFSSKRGENEGRLDFEMCKNLLAWVLYCLKDVNHYYKHLLFYDF